LSTQLRGHTVSIAQDIDEAIPVDTPVLEIRGVIPQGRKGTKMRSLTGESFGYDFLDCSVQPLIGFLCEPLLSESVHLGEALELAAAISGAPVKP
jgi:hypothetical protein